MKLSKYFTLAEMTFSQTAARKGIKNVPNAEQIENLRFLCEHLDRIREKAGAAVRVSSGFRSPALNKAVGGSPTSDHPNGNCADFNIDGYTPRQACELVMSLGIPYDQLILEFDNWCHIGIRRTGTNRRERLTYRKVGKQTKKFSGIV